MTSSFQSKIYLSTNVYASAQDHSISIEMNAQFHYWIYYLKFYFQSESRLFWSTLLLRSKMINLPFNWSVAWFRISSDVAWWYFMLNTPHVCIPTDAASVSSTNYENYRPIFRNSQLNRSAYWLGAVIAVEPFSFFNQFFKIVRKKSFRRNSISFSRNQIETVSFVSVSPAKWSNNDMT